jgi:hypothetical protein
MQKQLGKEQCNQCQEQQKIVEVANESNPRVVFCNECWKNIILANSDF